MKTTAQPDKRIGEILQTWDTEDLIAAIACTRPETWFAATIRKELVARGVDHKGQWCGRGRAAQIWRR